MLRAKAWRYGWIEGRHRALYCRCIRSERCGVVFGNAASRERSGSSVSAATIHEIIWSMKCEGGEILCQSVASAVMSHHGFCVDIHQSSQRRQWRDALPGVKPWNRLVIGIYIGTLMCVNLLGNKNLDAVISIAEVLMSIRMERLQTYVSRIRDDATERSGNGNYTWIVPALSNPPHCINRSGHLDRDKPRQSVWDLSGRHPNVESLQMQFPNISSTWKRRGITHARTIWTFEEVKEQFLDYGSSYHLRRVPWAQEV